MPDKQNTTKDPAAITIKVMADTTDLDVAIKKAERLLLLVKEAKSLADDLASRSTELSFDVQL